MTITTHSVKSVCIWSFSGPYIPAYGASLRIQSERGKIRTRKTLNKDTFHAVTYKKYLLIPSKRMFFT